MRIWQADVSDSGSRSLNVAHFGAETSGGAGIVNLDADVYTRILRIEEESVGYFLHRFGMDMSHLADTWHQSLEEAMEQAEEEFGVPPAAWSLLIEG